MLPSQTTNKNYPLLLFLGLFLFNSRQVRRSREQPMLLRDYHVDEKPTSENELCIFYIHANTRNLP